MVSKGLISMTTKFCCFSMVLWRKSDQSLFICSKDKILAIFLVYIDDIMLSSSCKNFTTCTSHQSIGMRIYNQRLGGFAFFSSRYSSYILLEGGWFSSQQHYISNLLHGLKLENLKLATTPMEVQLDLNAPSECLNPSQSTIYRQVIGSIQYLTTIFSSTIFFGVKIIVSLCQYLD